MFGAVVNEADRTWTGEEGRRERRAESTTYSHRLHLHTAESLHAVTAAGDAVIGTCRCKITESSPFSNRRKDSPDYSPTGITHAWSRCRIGQLSLSSFAISTSLPHPWCATISMHGLATPTWPIPLTVTIAIYLNTANDIAKAFSSHCSPSFHSSQRRRVSCRLLRISLGAPAVFRKVPDHSVTLPFSPKSRCSGQSVFVCVLMFFIVLHVCVVSNNNNMFSVWAVCRSRFLSQSTVITASVCTVCCLF